MGRYKKAGLFLFYLIILCWMRPGFTQEVSLWDFRLPLSRVSDLDLSVYLNLQDQKSGYSENYIRKRSEQERIYLRYYHFLDSEELSYWITFYGWGNRVKIEEKRPYGNYSSDKFGYHLNLDTKFKRYLRKGNFFTPLDMRVDYRKDYKRVWISGFSGVGYGRFRDATPLIRAKKIERKLLEYHILTEELDSQSLLKLSQIIYRQPEYMKRYESTRWGPYEYYKYFFSDIEDVLIASGKLKNGQLSTLGAYLLLEGLQNYTPVRLTGFEIILGPNFRQSDYLKKHYLRGSPELDFNLGLPLSYRTHFSHQFQLKYNSKKFPWTDHDLFDLNAEMSLIHELWERVDFIVMGSYNRIYDEFIASNIRNYKYSNTEYQIFMSFRFYIRNDFYISLNGGRSFQKRGRTYLEDGVSPYRREAWENSLTLSLNYDIPTKYGPRMPSTPVIIREGKRPYILLPKDKP